MARRVLLQSTMDDFKRMEDFVESGRGLPVQLSRPSGALPFSAITRQAYAPSPRARLGWAQGSISVEEVPLEPARAVRPGDSLTQVAARLRDDDAGFAAVVDDEGRFLGVVFVEDVLKALADGKGLPEARALVSTQIPTCAPRSALVDAVRQMIACWLRKLPVVGDDGALLGFLGMSAAAAAAERDPAVQDVLDGCVGSPAFFARRWR